MSLSRRGLLAGLAAGLTQIVPQTVHALQGRRVIVVGAGLAGLAAARDLQAMGADVQVLEARARIGGRIWTSRLWRDLPMDLGASWIHGTKGNPLTKLADQAGAGLVHTDYDSAMALDAEGQELDLSAAYDLAARMLGQARAKAERLDADVSVKAAVEATDVWAKADPARLRQLRHVLSGSLEAEYGGSLAEMSGWYYDDSQEFSGPDALFPGGFDQIIRHLARGLDIRTKTVVTGVAQDGAGARLTLRGGERLTADHVIITLPLGVLQAGDITFDPPLSPARQTAISALGMGLLNKCWLRFDRISWPDDVDWIEWLGPRPGGWAQWVSLGQALSAPVLLAFHAADAARDLERQSDAATMDAAHQALKSMFGTRFAAPIAAQITRWSQDPYSRGAYSFHAVGSGPQSRAALGGAEWQGALVFAGEACSPEYWGTAHGAVLSGRLAAKAIRG